jgi:methyl-accepting chemotaxis protein
VKIFATVGGRITLLSVVPALAVGMLAVIGSMHSLGQLRDSRLQASLEAAADHTEDLIRKSIATMGTYATALAQDAGMVAAVAAGDGAALRAHLVPAFVALRGSDPRISVLEVTDARGVVVLRGHNPGQAGDNKSAVADVARALRGEAAAGITVSPTSGEMAYGTVVPLRREGRIVGTLKVAGRMNDATARDIARLVEGHVALVGGQGVKASTVQGIEAQALQPVLATGSPAWRAQGMEQAEGPLANHRLRALPVADMAGQQAGAVLIALPLAKWQEARRQASAVTLGAAGLVLLLALPVALLAARRIGRNLGDITAAMREVAAGRTDLAIPGVGRRDEIGAMARALAVFQEDARRKAELEQAEEQASRARERRSGALERYSQDFGSSIAGVLARFAQSAALMRESAERMGEAAQQTRAAVDGAADDSARSAQDLSAVAAAVEELSATVTEISRQVAGAASIAAEAAQEAKASDERLHALTQTAERIGDVIGLISDVAQRTNLLALNATIEAARAGEAGKGFAVVAGEVKNLAAQTAKATDEVASQVAAMRQAANEAATTMQGMASTIGRIDETTATIAAAVEEQGAATREITSRLQGVSTATAGVSEAMTRVAGTAQEARATSDQVKGAAGQVQEQADMLRQEVDGFLANLHSDRDERRRFERHDVGGRPARLSIGGRTEEVTVQNISAGGCALRTSREAPLGSEASLTFPEQPGEALHARVSRSGDGQIALVFTDTQRAEALVKQLFATARARAA